MASFVFIKLAAFGHFTKLETRRGDDISDLAERACVKFTHWGANAGMLSLYLVAQGGPEPSEDAITAVIAAGSHLSADKSLKCALITTGAWLVARVSQPPLSPATPPAKKFFLMVREEEFGESVSVKMDLAISSDLELRALVDDHGKGSLIAVGTTARVRCLEDIVEGGIYTLLGGYHKAFLEKQLWTQQSDKVLGEVSTLAVRDAFGGEMSSNVVFKNRAGSEKEIDGLLIKASTAIAVEAKHAAVPQHVVEVLKKADFLLSLALENSDKRLQGVTTVVPVLASSRLSAAIIALCELNGIGTVKPNGAGHTYTPPSLQWTALPRQRSMHTIPGRRSLHTLARVLRLLL